MNYKEALKSLECLEAAVRALEKQVPQEPINNCCPMCDSEVTYFYCGTEADENIKERVYDAYCGCCGQKINWDDIKEY